MVIPDGVIRGILLPRTVLEAWMEHVILPIMSIYRVMHTDYIYPHSCAYSEHNLRSYVHDPVLSPLNGILSL